ncbi:Nitroreductase [Marinospirillum celere]|uniref:Putative NAD(P)H nitroreductase n=1 Tax=Marinospirillum celere TaxID=1122252 RepID=A0A1I1DYD7_9GAMM|nr:nitroreductase family protein [Marinospirillum celere]SFB78008.1 Nitroreductase [Marinospirillum celere]
MQAIELLLNRNSHPKLIDPAPQGSALGRIYQAALRAPDHADLRPWHFIEFSGEGRERLGKIFVEAELVRNPGVDIEVQNKMAKQPLRAPMVIAVVAKIQEHPKVPASEQLLSAGCAAHGLLLAAEAEGFAGMWRSGWVCFDPLVKEKLGLNKQDELVGFIYLGSLAGRKKPLPEHSLEEFVEKWT